MGFSKGSAAPMQIPESERREWGSFRWFNALKRGIKKKTGSDKDSSPSAPIFGVISANSVPNGTDENEALDIVAPAAIKSMSNGPLEVQHLGLQNGNSPLPVAVEKSGVVGDQHTSQLMRPVLQIAGHEGHFRRGERPDAILKVYSEQEERCFVAIQKDSLRIFTPPFRGRVILPESDSSNKSEAAQYLELEDLLFKFRNPSVMDCKMGVRTYLEEELITEVGNLPRKDLFSKMVAVDPKAPTDEENAAEAVSKVRYMCWREKESSTGSLGFRIDGIHLGSMLCEVDRGGGNENGASDVVLNRGACDSVASKKLQLPSKDLKTLQDWTEIQDVFRTFLSGYSPRISELYLNRLEIMKNALSQSYFFEGHELIGTSLLFVHDEDEAGVWMIDFAKTFPLPNGIHLSHDKPWEEGNHEDGFLIGLQSLIDMIASLCSPSRSGRQDNSD